MRIEELILWPWAVVIPYAVFYLLRANYRANSGLCPYCGEKLRKPSIETVFDENMQLTKKKCQTCREKRLTHPKLKAVLVIGFIVWMYKSIAVFREISLVGW
jgi:DNA-directed RNA polymerase subunit RPC12/RpoP